MGWTNWPVDLHRTVREAVLDALGDCAPAPCDDTIVGPTPDCTAFGFNGGLDVWPLGGCCEALTVSPGNVVSPVGNGCWRIAQQEFTVRLLTGWPLGAECRDDQIDAALRKLSRCGQAFHCALAGLALPTFSPFSTGNCRAVVFNGSLMAIGPQGGCVGWQARILVGK